MISDNTLEVLKALVRLALLREQDNMFYGALQKNSKYKNLISELLCNPPDDLMEAIQLHRVATILEGDSLIKQLFHDLRLPLKELAIHETFAALALASLTREMSALFESKGLPMLVLKGIPLSLQTTCTLTARGRGDLDLWVRSRDLADAINLLKTEGFRLAKGFSCVADSTFQGLYSRFVSIEISLMRTRGRHIQFIDLHWHPSHTRGVLPSFKTIWEQREYVSVNGQSIATLPKKLAFVHYCCHANHDYWRSLRQLVDVVRLGMILPRSDILELSKSRPVSKTCCVAAELTEKSVFNFIYSSISVARASNARREAKMAQLFLIKNSSEQKWIFSRIQSALRVLNCHHHPAHFFSHLLFNFVTPPALMDSKSGRYRPLHQIILYRWNLFRKYMNHSED